MTAANEEAVRASYAAFSRGDVDAALTLFADDIQWTHPDGMSKHGLGGTKTGHHEVRQFMVRARAVFSEIRPEPREFIASGDRVAVFGVHHMRGASSGRCAVVPFVHSWRFADGRATHFDDIHDTAPVLAILDPPATGDDVSHLFQLGMQFMPARVLQAAVEVGVFTQLADQPLNAEQLRQRLGLGERGVRDFLDALVALGLLDRRDDRYANTPLAATYLGDPAADTYLGGFIEYAGSQWYHSWAGLTDTLRTGQSQTYGDRPFDAIYANPQLADAFQRAMTSGSVAAAMALPDAIAWHDYRTVADIGCSDGPLLARLLRAHPHLTGIGFDLPQVAQAFEATVARHGLATRMAFTAGDFLNGPLPTADVLILGHVLVDWDLPTRRALLAKAYDALPEGGRIIIYDILTMTGDERRRNITALLVSLNIVLDYPGGSTYSAADCLSWLTDIGFRDCRAAPLAGPEHLVTAVK